MSQSTSKHQHWCVTVPNYTDSDLQNVRSIGRTMASYLVFQREVGGENGLPHLQVYVEFANGKTFDRVRRMFGNAHVERRRGNRDQARDYCMKHDTRQPGTVPEEIGSWVAPERGRRSDLVRAWDAVQSGRRTDEVLREYPAMFRYVRALSAMQSVHLTEVRGTDFRRLNVVAFHGPPGTGKTRRAYAEYPGLFRLPPVINGTVWWDGYMGQDTVLIDDFCGDVPFRVLLQWTDGYPIQLPVKGGFVPACFTTVIITSNDPPPNWYPGERHIDALLRRISLVQEVTGPPPEEPVPAAALREPVPVPVGDRMEAWEEFPDPFKTPRRSISVEVPAAPRRLARSTSFEVDSYRGEPRVLAPLQLFPEYPEGTQENPIVVSDSE